MTVSVLDNCTGCGRCVAACSFRAIILHTEQPDGFGRKIATIDEGLCTDCADCLVACPHQALALDKS